MRSAFRAFSFLAALLGIWLVLAAATLHAQQEEVEDTVVADEVDSRPLFERRDDAPQEKTQPATGTPQRGFRRTAKNRYAVPDPALELADPRTYRLKVTIRISAPNGPVKGITATCPIPMDWPEQRVRLLSQDLSPASRVREEVLPGQAAFIKYQVPFVKQGESAFVERMYEITRYRTKFTLPGDELQLPKRTPAELKDQLSGIAPGVEINDRKMIELAETLRSANLNAGPWDTAKAFWSWTRDNVKFENGDFRGAMHAIEQRCGDCEEMSALFVGLCRLSNIPARTVWVHSHDYPEFYLVDQRGKGHWIPAQVLGPAWFGEMAEYRPIFQKGDRFYDPLKKEFVRYVPQTVRGTNTGSLPVVEIKHDILADSDINAPSYQNP